MAGGQPLRLGPFTGGLNTASDATAIADAELAELTNLELDIDGSLISRTPAQERQGHISWSERIICIGEGIFTGTHYLIGSNISGVYYYLNATWTLITSTFQASIAVQYADKVYLVPHPSSVNPGGKWDPAGGFVAVAAIPKGQSAVVHKERLFISPGTDAVNTTSRLNFSDPGNLDSWPGANFIDIGQGDGTKLIDLTIFQDNLLLFKNQSTYVLSYDIRPTDATVRKISSTIGVDGQFCVANYENQVYVFHGGWVYEILNFDFNRLNTKVPFIRDESIPSAFSPEKIFLSIVQDRLYCRFYKKVYIYGMRTRTWSEWQSNSESLQFFGPILTIRPSTGNEYYSGSCILEKRSVIKFFDKQTSTDKEFAFNTLVTSSDNFSTTATDSWGTSDQGLAWVNTGGSATDYDKTGGEGTHSLTSVAVSRRSSLALGLTDVHERVFIRTSALAVTNGIIVSLTARDDGGGNLYFAQVSFNADNTINLLLVKTVAGVTTILQNVVTGLTHVAGTKYGLRFRIQGTQLQTRFWLATNPEPVAWTTTATDASLVGSGSVRLISALNTGNTNTLPVTIFFDDFQAISLVQTNYIINCSARTKNFDMAVSHQFKRLWWWGVDLSTPNDIIGTVTPIILSFGVTWQQMNAFQWNQLNTWSQPLSTSLTEVTTIIGQGGLSRRFAKFMKSLRYRQINFMVALTTDGSTSNGPARIFTITVVTETKATVPKAVN
jgi:hypothetical protein